MKRVLLAISGLLLFVAAYALAGAPTTINDFHLPGSQPLQSGAIDVASNCGCHANYDESYEPRFTWEGSMMAHAAGDPVYLAALAVANQDAPESGDLCIRCHTPKGWLEGRSTPTDGSALTKDDRESVVCHFCHKAIKPAEVGQNPYPDDSIYTDSTYPADQLYLGSMTDTTSVSGNGYYIVDSLDWRRGPFPDAQPPHNWHYSPFHLDAAMCGTCHDVSNPVFSKDANGKYVPNSFDTPSPNFDTYEMFPVERTYSEWKKSAYNTPEGVYAPQFGGNKDTVRTCQDCHMHTVTGQAAKGGGVPTRDNMAVHDLTGGNTFTPLTLESAFPNDNLDLDAIDSGVVRAGRMLHKAATMVLTPTDDGSNHLVDVEITNQTGHKLPSGYPEGRRIWINVAAYNESDQMIYESGAYDTTTGVLTQDADLKEYHIQPGVSNSLAGVVGQPAGPSFHFVLNDTVYLDNRIPPRGFTNAAFDSIQSPPVGYSYADGQYWDNTDYTIPGAAAKVRVTLFYQAMSKEYIEFLRDENATNDWGDSLYSFWSTFNRSLPVAMVTDSVLLTPIQGANQPPVLSAIGPQTTPEGVLLSFTVSATDPDGPAPQLTTSTLPGTATFHDNGDGTGLFSWTPTYDDAGLYSVTFYATDDSAAVDSEVVPITVTNVNQPPVLSSIGPQTTAEGVLLSFAVSATDPDGTIPQLTTSTLPGTATFDDHGDGTGQFNWTPTYDDAGSYSVTFYATDDSAAVDSQVVAITVTNVNRAPVLSSIGSQTVVALDTLTINVSASDPDLDPITLSAAPLPGTATFNDNGDGTGTFEWTPLEADTGTYDVVFVASDGNLADSETVAVTVLPPGSCCIAGGNVDHSADGAVNVSDLTYLVAFVFKGGPAPPCIDEADVDGSGAINVSDVTWLVAYIFKNGQAPAPCP